MLTLIRIVFVSLVWLFLMSCVNVNTAWLTDTNGVKHFYSVEKTEGLRFCELHNTWEKITIK